jgi:Fur family transcriptional regulator, ferric uptake regulator
MRHEAARSVPEDAGDGVPGADRGRVPLSFSAMPTPGGLDQALDVFETFLRRKGLKMTEQRRTMVASVLAIPGHFTAVDAHERMRTAGERVSLATVYRALGLLEEAGVLEGHDFEDGQRRYERALTREHHDHLICLDCRAVVEFQNSAIEALQDQVLEQHGFAMVHHALTIFASCEQLRATGGCTRRDAERRATAGTRGSPSRRP